MLFLLYSLMCIASLYAMHDNLALIVGQSTIIHHIDQNNVSELKKLYATIQKLSDQDKKDFLETINFNDLLVHSIMKEHRYLKSQENRIGYLTMTPAISSFLILSCNFKSLENICYLAPTAQYATWISLAGAAALIAKSGWNSFRQYQIRKELNRLSELAKKTV